MFSFSFSISVDTCWPGSSQMRVFSKNVSTLVDVIAGEKQRTVVLPAVWLRGGGVFFHFPNYRMLRRCACECLASRRALEIKSEVVVFAEGASCGAPKTQQLRLFAVQRKTGLAKHGCGHTMCDLPWAELIPTHWTEKRITELRSRRFVDASNTIHTTARSKPMARAEVFTAAMPTVAGSSSMPSPLPSLVLCTAQLNMSTTRTATQMGIKLWTVCSIPSARLVR